MDADMKEPLDPTRLDRLEEQTYLSRFDDGLLDLLIGLGILGFAVGVIVGEAMITILARAYKRRSRSPGWATCGSARSGAPGSDRGFSVSGWFSSQRSCWEPGRGSHSIEAVTRFQCHPGSWDWLRSLSSWPP
jgi:hypothetical protein